MLTGKWEPLVPICNYNTGCLQMWSVWGRGVEGGMGGAQAAWRSSLLGLALGSHSFHGFAYGLFIP